VSVVRTTKAADPKATAAKASGFGSASVTVKHASANAHQRSVLETVIGVGVGLNAPPDVLVMAVMCVTQESVAGQSEDRGGAAGPFSKLSQSNGVSRDAHDFYKGGQDFQGGGAIASYAKYHGQKTLGWMVTDVQRDYTWGTSRQGADFQQWRDEAQKTVAAYQGTGAGSFADGGSAGAVVVHRYEFTRGEKGGKKENSWDASGRLATELLWSRWAAGNVFAYASQDELIAQPPSVTLDGTEAYLLDFPQWEWGSGRPIHTLTFHVLADRWGVMPGGVIEWDQGMPWDGRWLVSAVSGDSLDSPVVEVVVKRPTHKRNEPANETSQKAATGAAGDAGSSAGAGPLGKLSGTPKEIIDRYVLPVGRKHGMLSPTGALTPSNVDAANAQHGSTTSGGRSDHQGPPSQAWAADMDNPHREENPVGPGWACAKEVADMFGISNGFGSKRGALVEGNKDGYHIQVIYGIDLGTAGGGNHKNHCHCGVHRA
jgi:hypothetical protein